MKAGVFLSDAPPPRTTAELSPRQITKKTKSCLVGFFFVCERARLFLLERRRNLRRRRASKFRGFIGTTKADWKESDRQISRVLRGPPSRRSAEPRAAARAEARGRGEEAQRRAEETHRKPTDTERRGWGSDAGRHVPRRHRPKPAPACYRVSIHTLAGYSSARRGAVGYSSVRRSTVGYSCARAVAVGYSSARVVELLQRARARSQSASPARGRRRP